MRREMRKEERSKGESGGKKIDQISRKENRKRQREGKKEREGKKRGEKKEREDRMRRR